MDLLSRNSFYLLIGTLILITKRFVVFKYLDYFQGMSTTIVQVYNSRTLMLIK